MQKYWKYYLISITLCLLVGFLAGMATQESVDTWYSTLKKPFFTPPNWLFAPVWTFLYILMGISAGLVWSKGFHHIWVKTALYHFGFQLILNGIWSLVFFGLREIFWALLVIIGLLVLILLTIKWFRVVSKKAAILLFPYLAWVSFATLLNFSLWWLNK